jgi:hypothetical protein
MKKKPKLTNWAKGAPPSVGVWNASTERNPEIFRHWNGWRWSVAGTTPITALAKRDLPTSSDGVDIEWRGLAEPPQ